MRLAAKLRVPILIGFATLATATARASDRVAEVAALLSGIPGVKVTRVGDAVVVDGMVDSIDHMKRIIGVVDGLTSVAIHNLATLSPMGKADLGERITKEIGSPTMTVRLLNNVLMLEGIAPNDFEADRAVEIAKTFIVAPATRVPGAGESSAIGRTTATASAERQVTPIFYNRNELPTTLMDMLRVTPRPGTPPANRKSKAPAAR